MSMQTLQPPASISTIKTEVARTFGVGVHELENARRARAVARPRQVAMYLAREMTPRSLPEIGRAFGGRDHTTVMHAVRRVEALMACDPKLKATVERLRQETPRVLPEIVSEDLDEAARDARNAAVLHAKKGDGGTVVGPAKDIRAALQETFGERATNRARTAAGEAVELFVGPGRTWSLVGISRDGARASLIVHGENWADIRARKCVRPTVNGPKKRRCLKCGKSVRSTYPGLCESCRRLNRQYGPLAEGA